MFDKKEKAKQERREIVADTHAKLDRGIDSTDRLKKLLEANGIGLHIFVATGGDRRRRNNHV